MRIIHPGPRSTPRRRTWRSGSSGPSPSTDGCRVYGCLERSQVVNAEARAHQQGIRKDSMFGQRLTFRHGVHPPDSQGADRGLPIRRMPFPNEVVLPLSQHAGKPAKLVVRAGRSRRAGRHARRSRRLCVVPVHASAAGTVVDDRALAPSDGGSNRPSSSTWSPLRQVPRPRMVPDWHGLTPEQSCRRCRTRGVVGLGGAAFPTHVKLVAARGQRHRRHAGQRLRVRAVPDHATTA